MPLLHCVLPLCGRGSPHLTKLLHASITNPFSCNSFWIKKTATHKASSTCFGFTRDCTLRVGKQRDYSSWKRPTETKNVQYSAEFGLWCSSGYMSSPSNHLCVLFHLFCCPPCIVCNSPFLLLIPHILPFLTLHLNISSVFFFIFYSSYLYAVNFLLILFPLLFHLLCALFCFLLRLLRYTLLHLHFLFLLVISFHCFSYHSSFFFSSPSFTLSSLFNP